MVINCNYRALLMILKISIYNYKILNFTEIK